jgi:splicing suppressor protein 51
MDANACAQCQRTAAEGLNLKRCAKCQSTRYCSRECQRAHWKAHKKECATNGAGNPSSTPNVEHSSNYRAPPIKNLEKQIPKPFTGLDKGTYLHGRSEEDVFKLLIDAFRMRQADAFKYDGKVDPNSVYTGATSSIQGFKQFMHLAASRNLLPPWWSAEKLKQCEDFGENGDNWSSLRTKVVSTPGHKHRLETHANRTVAS